MKWWYFITKGSKVSWNSIWGQRDADTGEGGYEQAAKLKLTCQWDSKNFKSGQIQQSSTFCKNKI